MSIMVNKKAKEYIGVFDSGLGGLTVLKRIVKKMPNANIIYFGDTKRAPYGGRNQAELGALTANAFSFLKSKNATKIVTACNSVSTLLMSDFLETCDLEEEDVIEMSKPIASAMDGKYKKVLVLATVATVVSHMHRDALMDVCISVDEIAIPDLVDLIEGGATTEELEEHIVGILGNINVKEYDAVLFGCTHFPFALQAFKNVLGDDTVFIDPAIAVADKVAELSENKKGTLDLKFFITKESEVFSKKVKELFGSEYEVNVV